MCGSPKLFAAYHVFHRLSVPRHPPCALSCLTFLIQHSWQQWNPSLKACSQSGLNRWHEMAKMQSIFGHPNRTIRKADVRFVCWDLVVLAFAVLLYIHSVACKFDWSTIFQSFLTCLNTFVFSLSLLGFFWFIHSIPATPQSVDVCLSVFGFQGTNGISRRCPDWFHQSSEAVTKKVITSHHLWN